MQSHDLRESGVHHPNMTHTFLQTASCIAFMELDDWYRQHTAMFTPCVYNMDPDVLVLRLC